MKNSRLFTMIALLSVNLAGAKAAIAQGNVKPEDLIGTWERVNVRDLKTGAIVPASGAELHWMQLTRSHWIVIEMSRGRSVVRTQDFAKLSPDEKVKRNYARVWNDKGEQIFAVRGGTYRIDGDKLHSTITIALYTEIIGLEGVMEILRLDKATMVVRIDYPDRRTISGEYTYRRID